MLVWVVISLILIGITELHESFADLGYIDTSQEINEFFNPSGVAVDNDGNVFIVDVVNNIIKHYDSQGNLKYEWGSFCYFEYNLDDCTDPDGIFGLLSKGDGQFKHPTHIAVDANRVYVADYENYRIQVFDKEGNFLFKFGTRGDTDGKFYVISGLEISHDGQIYVADLENHRVQVFSKDGRHLKTFGDTNWLTKGSHKMSGLILDDKNNSYLINDRTATVSKFDVSGDLLLTFGSPGLDLEKPIQLQSGVDPKRLLQHLESIEVDNEGLIYLAGQRTLPYIDVFDGNGNYVYSLLDDQKKSDIFSSISDITFGPNGRMYVADNVQGHVTVLSNTGDTLFTIDGTEKVLESIIPENIETINEDNLESLKTLQPSFFDDIFRLFEKLFNFI